MKQNQILLDRTPPSGQLVSSDEVAIRYNPTLERVEAVGGGDTDLPFGNPSIPAGTPVSGVKATRTLTSTGVAPANGATVTIGHKTYTFQTTLTNVDGNVLIGASAAAALDNLKSAINLTAGAGTTYATATTANTEVSATTNTDTTQVVEALVAGAAGNTIPLSETSSVLSWASGTLTGGVDGTPAKKGETLFDGTYFYFANAELTTASTSGWRKIAHNAL